MRIASRLNASSMYDCMSSGLLRGSAANASKKLVRPISDSSAASARVAWRMRGAELTGPDLWHGDRNRSSGFFRRIHEPAADRDFSRLRARDDGGDLPG